MHAGELLGPLDSPGLRRHLLPVLADLVEVRPVPGWLRPVWPRWVAAMTMPWAIYVSPHVLTGDGGRLSALIVHELIHVRQWRRMGTISFLSRYLTEYVRGRLRRLGHRQAYLSITLEAEARQAVAQLS